MKIIWLSIILLGLSAFTQNQPPAPETSVEARGEWKILSNDIIDIGIDTSRGACIGYFGKSENGLNFLNHYDEGRFIQQSYYGQTDGSDWNGKPWVYNPVQGGSWDIQPSEIIELDGSSGQLYSKTMPRHWATGEFLPESIMEQTLMLDGEVAIMSFKFSYNGPDQGKPRHQEMPAVFVDGTLETLVYHKDGKMIKEKGVRILDEGKGGVEGLAYGRSTSNWFAWIDAQDHGIGIYTPGTEDFTCYRALGDGSTGEKGSSCSYISPLRTFALKKGMVLEYTAYLTIGTLSQIEERFEGIKTGSHP